MPEDPSDKSKRWLPVPAAFVVDSQGQVLFAYSDPNYKSRISGEKLLEAVKAATAQVQGPGQKK